MTISKEQTAKIENSSLVVPVVLRNKISYAEEMACQLETKICIEEIKLRDKHKKDNGSDSVFDYGEQAQITMKKLSYAIHQNPETKNKLLLQLDLLDEIGVEEDAFIKSVAVQRFTKNDTKKLLQLSNTTSNDIKR